MIQKSRVQEMFPINENKLWYATFRVWWAIAFGIACGLIGPFMILTFVVQPFDPRLLVATILGFCLGAFFLIGGYFFTNRSVKNYYFNVTDDSIVLGSKNILFAGILDIYVFQESRDGYGLRSTPRQKNSRSDAQSTSKEGAVFIYPIQNFGPFATSGIFDEKTAFALKEYILEKMKRAGV